MDLLYQARDGAVWRGDSLAEPLPGDCDLLCVDPPYGDRTHGGHDAGNEYAGHGENFAKADRRALDYENWTPAEVARAVAAWSPRTRGWFCVMSDHDLARAWAAELEAAGRYVFAPLPCYSPGSRVRLAGDGPSSWTIWLTVARPRHAPYCKWGTLPGGYVYPPERMPVVGGKPVGLMRAIVADYSRPGDIVCDPCCGAGSTIEAARDLGRIWVGVEVDPGRAAMAAGRMGAGLESGPLFGGEI